MSGLSHHLNLTIDSTGEDPYRLIHYHQSEMLIPVHLLIIIHGLWGTPDHVAHLADTIAQRASDQIQLEIFRPEQIQWTNTYDGIDFCAEKVAQELDQKLRELQQHDLQVVKFSCLGVS